MATEETVYLSYAESVRHHFELMLSYDEIRFGVDSRGLIKSALARPQHAAVYENADIVRQAATLCFGMIKNHPWLGGNKRTATYLMEIFLELNGYHLDYELVEIIELSLNVESDVWKVDEIENWLRNKVKKLK
ncbi:MAG TPA: type II toxin-antitoxin system death-on-curing family toxin [Pyrinomonadaceae bacterium]|nr:type II toxin-antitoxin system death-on-curing family toxin [Pyrinomonadaceae bacterium]